MPKITKKYTSKIGRGKVMPLITRALHDRNVGAASGEKVN